MLTRREGRPFKLVAIAATTLAAGLALSACSSSDSPDSTSSASPATSVSASQLNTTAMSAEDAESIDKVVDEAMKQIETLGDDEVPSVILGVWDPKKGSYQKAYGLGQVDPEKPAELDDAGRIGSVTKTFVATAVLQLVADGTLDLDAKVSEYGTESSEKYPEIGERTIRQLLSMRSGLPDFEAAITGKLGADPDLTSKVWTAGELVDVAMESGKVKPADKGLGSYSNTNYVVLGEVLESVTGKEVADLVTEKVIEPLGIAGVRYPAADDTTLPDPHTQGYITSSQLPDLNADGGDFKANTDVTDWTASWGNAAGIMDGTVDGLSAWAAAEFGSALLPADLAKERAKTEPLDIGIGYGLGMLKAGKWLGHFGDIFGWGTLAVRNPDTGVVVVAMANASGSGTAVLLEQLLLEGLYPGTTDLQ